MFAPYYQAYESLRPHSIEQDLEKYYDIYEVSETDLQDAKVIATTNLAELEDADTLHDLKIGLQKLHVVRKLFLCTLLALDADGGQLDFQRWATANETMRALSSLTAKKAYNLSDILGEEEGELTAEADG